MSRTNALFTDCLEMADAVGLEMIGKAEEILVENARLEAAARAVCLSMVGRMMEAILIQTPV